MLSVNLNVSMDRIWLQVFFFLVKQTYTKEREKRLKGVATTNNYNSY